MSAAKNLALMAGMLTKDIPWARGIRDMMNHSYNRGGMNFHQAHAWRGRKKSFLGYGYLPQTKQSNGRTFKLFPDTTYMVRNDGSYVRVHPTTGGRMIVGRKNIKRHLEELRKINKGIV
jgi:hypothetical protein